MSVLASVKLAPFLESWEPMFDIGGGDARKETDAGKRFTVDGGRDNPDCAMSMSSESLGFWYEAVAILSAVLKLTEYKKERVGATIRKEGEGGAPPTAGTRSFRLAAPLSEIQIPPREAS